MVQLLVGCHESLSPPTPFRDTPATIQDSPGADAAAMLPVSGAAAQILANLRARHDGGSADAAARSIALPTAGSLLFPAGEAKGFHRVKGGLTPRFATTDARRAKVVLPDDALASLHIEDVDTGLAVDVVLKDARKAAGLITDGYVVYPQGHASGATLLYRAGATGIEDFLSFTTRPSAPSVAYQLHLGAGVGGLRLVANTLELLDGDGAPRLRVEPPYVVGADGTRADATLAVDDCVVD
ncbi:MAG: hypothetical protein H7X95_13695, partial [Deltaproteobacteria bacterium]|nr:hypothetical protein [Deltaproteobacteria bacterium]